MRKTFVLMVAFMMLIGCGAALAEDPGYLSDFSGGTDGWYARSMGGAALTVTQEGALKIDGRSDNWHSPGRDFELESGASYELSVEVRQQDVEEAQFIISVAHSFNGLESYENLGFGKARKGEWTTVKGTYTAGTFDRFVLYVETANAKELSYEMRNFKLEGKLVEFGAEKDLPALKDVYANRFDFGTAVTFPEASNRKRMDFYASQFNIMTPGNELKPDSVLDVWTSAMKSLQDDTAVAVKFNSVMPLLEYAKNNGIKVHGHVLVWHQQTPEAFFHEHYNVKLPLVSREVMLKRLDNYVREIMTWLEEHYPGVVVSWDVVNEAIDDGTGKLRDSMWMKVVGEDYVARAFEIARRHAPEDVLLFYNDYNTAILVKQMGILTLLKELMAEGNIDGYGFQMHHDVNFPSVMQIATSLQRIADTGLKLRVSELDITIPDQSEASYQRQAKMYADIMKLLMLYPERMLAVQVWGVSDDLSWRASQYPLLFDGNAQPKPAFWAVADPASFK